MARAAKSLVSVGVRSGGTTEMFTAQLTLRDSALFLHWHIPPGPLAEAIDATRLYGFTLYGDDLSPLISVDQVRILGPQLWPDGADLSLNQRIGISEDPIVEATTARILGGL